jgi:hypothetical protein
MKTKFKFREITFFLIGMFTSLFFCKEANGLSTYSVTLKQINVLNLPAQPVDIQIKDGYAYIVCSFGDSGGELVSANIYDPNNIPPLNYYPNLSDKPIALAFNGSYAYIGQTDGVIKVINFKNRDLPIQTNYIEAIGKINKMIIYNGYLYFIRSDFGLNIYDVSVPDFPVSRGVQLVSGEATGLYVKNNYAFVTTSSANMSIIDISQISTLPIIGTYIAGLNFYDIFVNENYAYISQGATGVQVVDVSKLSSPVHETNIFSRKFSKQVVISGYYTWVNDDNSIQAFYNKNPKDQLWAGSFDNGGSSINKIDVEDSKYIYLCSSDNKLKIIQIYYNY